MTSATIASARSSYRAANAARAALVDHKVRQKKVSWKFDINGDTEVNVSDLLQVVGDWGQSNVPADINQDGVVNVSDLLLVMDAWGPC